MKARGEMGGRVAMTVHASRVCWVIGVVALVVACGGSKSADDAEDEAVINADDDSAEDSEGGADASVSPTGPVGEMVVSEMVDASEGGTITSADGVFSIFVPPDALDEDVEISVGFVPESQWPAAVADLEPEGGVYEVQPEGLRFAVPAQVRFDWETAPDAFVIDEDGEAALPGIVHSHSATGDVEELAALEYHFSEDGTGLRVAAETDHLSSKFVSATNRGCRLSVEAATGTFHVGSSWQATTFSFSCSGSAADDVQSVAPIAASSNTAVVSVSFASGSEGDRLLTSFSDDFWRPGNEQSLDDTSADLEKPTWSCVDEGDATISAGAIITRDGAPIAVTRVIGPVECELCELTEEDCMNLEQLDIDLCECICPHDESYDCPTGQQFNAQTCACECIISSCSGENEVLNEETCECECGLTQEDCPSNQSVDTEECTCACRQLQNCQGAYPEWNAETCECECNVTQDDCSGPHVFWDEQCECACPEAIAGEWHCPSDFQFRNPDTCVCECEQELVDDPSVAEDYCESQNRRWDAEACDCVCDVTEQDCTGNFRYDGPTCQCYCPLIEAQRECESGYTFNEETCECECDLQQSCAPDFQLNPDSCECECILDQEASCFPAQVLNQQTCECECPNPPQCDAPKVLDDTVCQCECDPALPACNPPLVRDPSSCDCVCEVSSADCTGATPIFAPALCACVPHAFYWLEGVMISIGPGCDDSDGQATIQNVTDTGFDLSGLGTNPPIPFTVDSGNGLRANGSGIIQFGQGNHAGILTLNAMAGPNGGGGIFSASSNSGSCQSNITYSVP